MCVRHTPDCLYTLTSVQDLRLHKFGFFGFCFACTMEEFQPVATHHSWPPRQFPEIIHKQRTIQKIRVTERNNLQPASGNHLTWGRMTTISLSQARVNLFCWGEKKNRGKLRPEIFFCLLQIRPSVFCHLSLNKMSHADWESSGNGGIQFIYRLRPEPL